jgi:hypothetical protein
MELQLNQESQDTPDIFSREEKINEKGEMKDEHIRSIVNRTRH